MALENVYISEDQIRGENIERFYEIVIYDELKRNKYQSWFTPKVERAEEIADILATDTDKYQEVHIMLKVRNSDYKHSYCSNQIIYSLVYAR